MESNSSYAASLATFNAACHLTAYLVIFALGIPSGWGQGFPGAPPIALPAEEAESEEEETEEEEPVKDDWHSLYYSAHLPIDRGLAQDLDQARSLLADGRFSEGLPLIDRVIAAEEDSFGLPGARRSTLTASGLKAAAKKLLAGLPPSGTAAHELEMGVTARRRLNQAIAAGDLAGIAMVASRYPLTEAAGDGLLLVAQAKIDAGDAAGAARLYEELIGWPSIEKKRGPLLAVRAALCWANSSDSANLDVAMARLENMNSSKEREQIRKLLGRQNLDDWGDALREHAAAEPLAAHSAGWLIEGGNLERNPRCTGGVPHVWPAWSARTLKLAHEAAQLQRRDEWQQERGGGWTLTASPLVVGDLVVARTPNNLIALDWRSGKRVWETRADRTTGADSPFHITDQQGGKSIAISLGGAEQRTWLDTVFGALSSDGQRVYAIRNLDSLPAWGANPWRMRVFGRSSGTAERVSGNALVAFDLHSEGKLVWQINGADAQGDAAGTFFLGPPLAVGELLYAIAEHRNSIQLIAIRAGDGHILWRQPLANLERSLQLDVGRRLAGVSPSYAKGLLVCPTGAGSVVAVDPIDHSLAWAYRFEVDKSVASRQSPGRNRRWSAYQPSLTGAWSRNRCLLAGDSVIVTAPESDELHCIDLETGEKNWTAKRGDGRFVAGVAKGNVMVVAIDRILTYDLDTGKQKWQCVFPKGATVAGLGVVTGDQLLLPFAGGWLGVFDIPATKLVATLAIPDDQPLGNLAYHRGTLLSQSTSTVVRFDQLERLRAQAKVGLAQSPPDPQSLRIQGEIAWGEGNLDAAIDWFRQAFEAEPEDALIRLRVVESLLAGLKADYPRYRDQSQLLAQLVEGQSKRLELLRLHVDGSLASGDPAAALEFALQLYQDDREKSVAIAKGHMAQSERWFAARVNRIWNEADDALRQLMTDEVNRLTQAARAGTSPESQLRLVRYFGNIPAGRRLRIAIATQLIDSQRLAEAELLLLRTDPEERRSQLEDVDPKMFDLFSRLCGYDAPQTHSTPTPDNIASESFYGSDRSASLHDWPDGKVTVERQHIAGARTPSQSSRSRSRGPQQSLLQPFSVGLPWAGPSTIAIAEGGGELIGWNELGEVSKRIELDIDSLLNTEDTSDVRCIRFGHFCAIGGGDEVAMLDLRTNVPTEARSSTGPILWASQSEGNAPTRYTRFGNMQMQIQMRGGQFFDRSFSRRALSDSTMRRDARTGYLCTATPQGVVLRDGDTLRCFDPVDGELLWIRKRMPADGQAFGDWQHLFLMKAGAQEGEVLSMIDGSTLGTWKRPEGKWTTTVAGNIVTTRYRGGVQHRDVVDALSGKKLVERSYAAGTCLAQVGAQWFLAVEKSGKTELIDAEQGEVRFTQQLLPEPHLSSVHALRSGSTIYLATNTRSQAQHNTEGNVAIADAPVVTGHVYALDAATGEEQWLRPATVEGQGLALAQVPATPVLLFLSEKEDRQGGRSNKSTRLLCLDKRTGRSLAREDKLPPLSAKLFAMHVDRGSRPTVTIDMRHTTLALRFTDAPRPPEPVANSEVEGVKKSVSAGLSGLWKKVLGGRVEIELDPVDEDD